MEDGAQSQSLIYTASYLDISDWTSYSQGKAPWSIDVDELTPLAAKQPFPRWPQSKRAQDLCL